MINQDVSKNRNLLNMLRSNGDLKIVFQIDKIGGYISENQTISFVDGIDKVYKAKEKSEKETKETESKEGKEEG